MDDGEIPVFLMQWAGNVLGWEWTREKVQYPRCRGRVRVGMDKGESPVPLIKRTGSTYCNYPTN